MDEIDTSGGQSIRAESEGDNGTDGTVNRVSNNPRSAELDTEATQVLRCVLKIHNRIQNDTNRCLGLLKLRDAVEDGPRAP